MPSGDTQTSKMRRASEEKRGTRRKSPFTILELHRSQMSTSKPRQGRATGKGQGAGTIATGTELPKVLRQFHYSPLISAGVHCQSSALVVPCSSEAGYYPSPWTSHVKSHHIVRSVQTK
ncbi:hypothetical protein TNCV_5026481 [Trichonephila clavipes]|uniref:Uncharacterized protein n=1 Tax=Trichonephila clavipes TaxID=2585209 RepID=A0A8X6RVE2_TRICX|nr:hypothetical protein TNCV_5026481 [Trichonephila clavipes]